MYICNDSSGGAGGEVADAAAELIAHMQQLANPRMSPLESGLDCPVCTTFAGREGVD